MYESNDKMVSHPPHYQSETGLEVIDVIEAFTFDLKGIEATDTGNVIKYICRWKGKNGLQDLEKAKWYLEHLIDHVRKLEEENKNDYTTVGENEPYSRPMTWWFDMDEKAQKCLTLMKDMLKDYGVVTVADFLNVVEPQRENGSYMEDQYGWINLDNAFVFYDASNHWYTLRLPKPIPIK